MYAARIQPDPAQWDAFVCQHPRSHFLQLSSWGELKSAFGWEPQIVALADSDGQLVAGVQLLYSRLPLRMGKLAYAPFGPLVDWSDMAMVRALFKIVDRQARQNGARFLKLEPGYDVDLDRLETVGCRLSPQTVQPPRTLLLDLDNPEAILKRMNQSTRRNIRKSEKNGVEVRVGERGDVDHFNALLRETADRQEFGVHVASYYEAIYDSFVQGSGPVQAALLMASVKGKDVAGIFVFVLGQQSWYLYGASGGNDRQSRASYGVQWAGVQWALDHGALYYDMVGVPDYEPDVLEERFEETSGGLWGVYRFKRGWGGRVVRTVGAWDRIYHPLIYWLYRSYLSLRSAGE